MATVHSGAAKISDGKFGSSLLPNSNKGVLSPIGFFLLVVTKPTNNNYQPVLGCSSGLAAAEKYATDIITV